MTAASHPLALEPNLIQQIAGQGGVRRFPAHAVIINEGDSSDALFIILSGRVKVYASSDVGKEVVISTQLAGEYAGELALGGELRSASVMTLEPTTCSIVTAATLRAFVEAHPDFAMHLIHKLIGRVRHATDRLESIALLDVYGRIVALLQELAVPGDGWPRVVPERLTQQDIADRAGAAREMVSGVFEDLVAGGYLSTGRCRRTTSPSRHSSRRCRPRPAASASTRRSAA